jgi:hypothetical protein
MSSSEKKIPDSKPPDSKPIDSEGGVDPDDVLRVMLRTKPKPHVSPAKTSVRPK